MALSADVTTQKAQPRSQTKTFVISNSQAMYVGGLCGTNSSGVLVPWANTAGYEFQGIFLGFEPAITDDGIVATTGDTANEPDIRGIVDVSGPILAEEDVTGVTAITDIPAWVYAGSDDTGDFTTTATANVGPVGYLVDFTSASSMDVQLLTPMEYRALTEFGTSITTLTDSTGGSASHNDTVADGQTATGVGSKTSATITGSLTGTVDGAMTDIAAIALATSDTYTDAAVNTAVNTAITAINVELKELQTAANEAIADIASLWTWARAAQTDLVTQNQNDSDIAQKVIEIVAALSK